MKRKNLTEERIKTIFSLLWDKVELMTYHLADETGVVTQKEYQEAKEAISALEDKLNWNKNLSSKGFGESLLGE